MGLSERFIMFKLILSAIFFAAMLIDLQNTDYLSSLGNLGGFLIVISFPYNWQELKQTTALDAFSKGRRVDLRTAIISHIGLFLVLINTSVAIATQV